MAESISMTHDWAGKELVWPLQHDDGVVKLVNTNDQFEVNFDCHFFKPEELEVKVANDRLFIHGRHEIRPDGMGGDIAREVTRTYKLPADVDTKGIKSHLDTSGVLHVSARKRR